MISERLTWSSRVRNQRIGNRGSAWRTMRRMDGNRLLRGAANLDVEGRSGVVAFEHGEEGLLGIVAEATVVEAGADADDCDIGLGVGPEPSPMRMPRGSRPAR